MDIQQEISQCSYLFLAIASILYGTAIGISIFRWKLLLDVQDARIGYCKLVQLAMIGMFFNLVIPGAVSGDFIKMFYVTSHTPKKKVEAVLTIFLDRILGLVGLFIVALISVIFSLKFILKSAVEIQLGAAMVCAGSFFAILFMFGIFYRQKLFSFAGIKQLIRTGKNLIPSKFLSIAQQLIVSLDSYQKNKIVILQALILSMAVHTSLALTLFSVAYAFHEKSLPLRHYFLTTQVANTVGAIPLTPAGIGSRDFVIYFFLHEAGVTQEKAGVIPTFFSLLLVSMGLFGGVVYVFTDRK